MVTDPHRSPWCASVVCAALLLTSDPSGVRGVAKYALGTVDGLTVGFPQGWNDAIGYKPLVR